MGRYGWRNRDGVKTASTFDIGESSALCRDCSWFVCDETFLRARARARRHTARTLHTTGVIQAKGYEYAAEPLA